MIAEPNISDIASLIGEPSRAAMLVALLGKDALPAGELAYKAYISPQTASSHLSKGEGHHVCADVLRPSGR